MVQMGRMEEAMVVQMEREAIAVQAVQAATRETMVKVVDRVGLGVPQKTLEIQTHLAAGPIVVDFFRGLGADVDQEILIRVEILDPPGEM